MNDHVYQHYEDGWIHLIIEGIEYGEYVMRCPHCAPSWFLYKPGIEIHEVCYMAQSDKCKKCCMPECELARGLSFTINNEEKNDV